MSSDYYGASRPDVKERDLAQNDAVAQTDVHPRAEQRMSASLELLAMAAYEAFRLSSAGRLGEMPAWPQLPPEAQADWRAVADAVKMLNESRGGDPAEELHAEHHPGTIR